jgi:hypothetical protein
VNRNVLGLIFLTGKFALSCVLECFVCVFLLNFPDQIILDNVTFCSLKVCPSRRSFFLFPVCALKC